MGENVIYLPGPERYEVETIVKRLALEAVRRCGKYPLGITIDLPQDDFGDTLKLNFTLERASKGAGWFYESMEDVEIDGIPGQKLRIDAPPNIPPTTVTR